jgi:hypothetical protein
MRVSIDVLEEHIASIFRVNEINSARNQQASRWQAKLSYFLGLFFKSEVGDKQGLPPACLLVSC